MEGDPGPVEALRRAKERALVGDAENYGVSARLWKGDGRFASCVRDLRAEDAARQICSRNDEVGDGATVVVGSCFCYTEIRRNR